MQSIAGNRSVAIARLTMTQSAPATRTATSTLESSWEVITISCASTALARSLRIKSRQSLCTNARSATIPLEIQAACRAHALPGNREGTQATVASATPTSRFLESKAFRRGAIRRARAVVMRLGNESSVPNGRQESSSKIYEGAARAM